MKSSWKIGISSMFVASCATLVIWHAHRIKGSRDMSNDVAKTRALAEQGDVGAQYRLGNMYGAGRGVERDYSVALRWYQAAAEKGDSNAEFAIGYMYDTGTGVQQDFPEAMRWYRKAANQNNRRAQCAIAAMFYDGRGVGRDWASAAIFYRQAAENGLSRAQYDLGYMYYYGQGLTQDRAEAKRWFRAALKQGDEHARQAFGYKLTPCRIAFLVILTLLGLVFAVRPWSLNIWEPNQRPQDFRAWFSVGVGWACLIDAGMGWWGYTHRLFWNGTYGVSGFMLSKGILNLLVCVLLGIFLLSSASKKATSESDPLVTSDRLP